MDGGITLLASPCLRRSTALSSVAEAVGWTPLVRLPVERLDPECRAEVRSGVATVYHSRWLSGP